MNVSLLPEGKPVHRKNHTRIIALIVTICMLAGIAVGIFVIWPPLLPILFIAGVLIYLLFRYTRGKRGNRLWRGKHGK